MTQSDRLQQLPAPGTRLVRLRGDCLRVLLRTEIPFAGTACIRTNLEKAPVRREELIAAAEHGRPVLARDWHDVTMSPTAPGVYEVVLPLLQPGIFEVKTYTLPDGSADPVWVPGANVTVKVEPAFTACSNTIYNAFPRQFGHWRSGHTLPPEARHAIEVLDAGGYAVIPPSGTFRDLIQALDLIIDTMGFRIIQLLPIHPVPTTYARMGRYGSPFAALDFFDVDPALAEFDRKSTPLEQFRELVDAIHARNARVFIDLPANHTGWASHLQVHHPTWFARETDGTFVSPGAWGVVWEDLCKLDYAQGELWQYMAEVFLHWCRQGVDGFRCDAGYMVPIEVWEYITAKVRREFPETVFLLEGLGGPAAITENLLLQGNLDWAYSELFQHYGAADISRYLDSCRTLDQHVGAMVHFAETHDNNRLAATSQTYSRMRIALSALCAEAGAYGITNGVEWFAEEKLDVHGASNLNWGNETNQVDWLRRLRLLLDHCPAFHAGAELHLLPVTSPDTLAFRRRSAAGDSTVLVLVNLDHTAPHSVSWTAAGCGAGAGATLPDLLTSRPITCRPAPDGQLTCDLPAGGVLCLALGGMTGLPDPGTPLCADPQRVTRQRLQAAALDIVRHLDGFAGLGTGDPEALADTLQQDPLGYVRALRNESDYLPLVEWSLDRDRRRVVMLPPDHLLLLRSAHRFRAELCRGDRRLAVATALPAADGSAFAFLSLPEVPDSDESLSLLLVVHNDRRSERLHADILALSANTAHPVCLEASAPRLQDPELHGLCTTDLGGMTQARAAWGRIHSKYDALLAANLHPDVPVDRTVLFSRCRAWLVCRGYSQPLDVTCQLRFQATYENQLCWEFCVPVGMGRSVGIRAVLRLERRANQVSLQLQRRAACDGGESALPDATPVTLILRPDLEDRPAHEITRALDGPEEHFPAAVSRHPRGFRFSPRNTLTMTLSAGQFVSQPEWQYMVPLPFEQQRGLESATDLFSPGYFQADLLGGGTITLRATAAPADAPAPAPAAPGETAGDLPPVALPYGDALRQSLAHFVVKRDAHRSVIAGYPWFLDWGRDTLIAVRGLIAAGDLESCRDILVEFAGFENQGTLPNMIRGNDDSNRDTSDAPLWLFTGVADFIRATGNRDILAATCRGRPMLTVLLSIAEHYRSGTPNGIRLDPESALVFSPAHFTWMDTNHPAATPRQGYPVEIQALWIAALDLLAQVTKNAEWGRLAKQARAALEKLYATETGFLADCLHADPATPAHAAQADDANRPNQLLALTLDAVTRQHTKQQVLHACAGLLVPCGIRSLDHRPLQVPLPVYHHGHLLNTPSLPYWGSYGGDEDTQRKPAYHNGTAWSWLFPSYCEALVKTYGSSALATARAILHSGTHMLQQGCLGHVAEVLDGDAPHHLRGCGAQAWGAAELYRVHSLLDSLVEQVDRNNSQKS